MPHRLGQEVGVREERGVSGAVASRIANDMVQLLLRYTGRGPTKARTTVNTNLIVVVFEDTLTRAEKNLADAGQGESVAGLRRTLGSLMRPEAIELVEDATDRKVIAFMGDVDPEANVAAAIFVLERLPETGVAGTATAAAPPAE